MKRRKIQEGKKERDLFLLDRIFGIWYELTNRLVYF
jgi:hypothetical protein